MVEVDNRAVGRPPEVGAGGITIRPDQPHRPCFLFLIYPMAFDKNKLQTSAGHNLMSTNPTASLPGSPTPVMPTTASPGASTRPSPFLERLIGFLMPYFHDLLPDPAAARAEILETLASYGGRSRSEVINAARIIAFSFSALDILAEAQGMDMSASMRLRHRGCANGLNRSCQQNEQTLAKRLTRELPAGIEPTAEPANDMPEPLLEDAILTAEAQIAAHRKRLAATTPHPAPPSNPSSSTHAPLPPYLPASLILPSRTVSAGEQQENARRGGKAMVNIPAEIGMPVQPIATG